MAQPETASEDMPLLVYASAVHVPAGAGGAEGGEAYWDGQSTLVVRNGSTLMERCVLCGEPGAGGAIRLTLTWDDSFHLTGKTTLELRQQARVHAFLCRSHRMRWARARLWGGGGGGGQPGGDHDGTGAGGVVGESGFSGVHVVGD